VIPIGIGAEIGLVICGSIVCVMTTYGESSAISKSGFCSKLFLRFEVGDGGAEGLA
jgi:hypothetical protein